MAIKNIQIGQAGLSGTNPSWLYIDTNDTLATVTTAGYLNGAAHEYINSLSPKMMALVSTMATQNIGTPPVLYLLQVQNNAGVWSLAAPSNDIPAPLIVAGNIQAGSSGIAGDFISFPLTAAKGSLIFKAVANTGNTNTTVSNAAMGQASVVSIPDPGTATANFLLDTGTGATATITKISTGATPVPFVDPGSCTITAAAGAANTATITIQLKDGAGVNIARKVAFKVYSSSAADGLTLATAASTGFSVASGGLSLNNGGAITTQISAISSASGGCVLSLLDTGKQTSYLVLVIEGGSKTSAQLSAGSYG